MRRSFRLFVALAVLVTVLGGAVRSSAMLNRYEWFREMCGVERWSVKTGTDADVSKINLSAPTATTIATMIGWPAQSSPPANNRISPYETTLWVVNATLIEYKKETDEDYHLVLKDSAGNTMIAEIPAPNCVGSGSPLASGVTNARNEFDAKYNATSSFQTVSIPVRVTGVGMFDFAHGQTGAAANQIELHPVIDIIFNPGSGGTPPAAPTGLAAAAGNAQNIMTWNASSGATSYNLYRATSSGAETSLVTGITGTSYTNTGLTNGTTYYYQVTAVNASGESGKSNEANATPTGGTGGGGTTQLLGNPGFENGSSSPAPWTVSSGVIDSGTSEAAHGGTWKAWMCGYGSAHSDTLSQTVTIPATTTSATLSFWLHIDTAETTTTTANDTLQVQIRNSSGTVLTTLATYSNLNANTGYAQKTFDVSAYIGQTIQVYLAGTENASLQTSFVVDDFALNAVAGSGGGMAPAAPSGLAAAAGNGQVSLSWNASSGATSYTLYRSTTSGSETSLVTGITGTSYTNTGLTNGTIYYYKVAAVNAAGTSGLSNEASAAPTGGGTPQQLLVNPGFENGSSSPAPWVTASGVIDSGTSEAAHTGTWKAWLDGYGSAHTDTLYQQVAIPSTITTATLSFWLHIDTAETTTTTVYDTLKVQVRNSSGTVLTTLATYSNLNANTGYAQKTFDLSAYKGQTVQIYLIGVEDSSSQTSFVVDDFALNVQ